MYIVHSIYANMQYICRNLCIEDFKHYKSALYKLCSTGPEHNVRCFAGKKCVRKKVCMGNIIHNS